MPWNIAAFKWCFKVSHPTEGEGAMSSRIDTFHSHLGTLHELCAYFTML